VLVHRLFRRLGAPLCRDAADALWCSILTDTGSFRYASTNPEALRIAAELLEAGVDPWHHASQLYESVPAAQLALLARVLGTLRLSADGRCAALVATEEMIREAGATAEMLDGFVNYGRQVAGIELALLARPGNDGLARVSLRSRGRANVAELARRFGGGGHYAAAGLKLALPPQQAAERVLREAEALLAAGALERAAGGEGCGPGGGNRVGDSEGRGKHGEGHGAEGRG
jgi:phosphoesterase RecJ-like protein